MATLATLTDDVFDMVYGMTLIERPQEDTLTSAVSGTTDTTFQFDNNVLWKRGVYAEDASAGEIVIMAADQASSSDVTVRRGQNGTTAAASYAIGDVFYKNPPYPRYRVERFINETIDSNLFPNVWMWGETTLSFVSGDTTYEMPTNCGDVARVYQYDLNSDGKLYPIDGTLWEFESVVASGISTNENFLRLFRVKDEAATVYVTYKQIPDSSAISDLSDNVAAMVPWAVCGKLLAGTRLVPTRTAPGRATPVANQSGSQLISDYGAFDTVFRRMRKDEKLRLNKEVPLQKRFRGIRVRQG